MSTDSEKTAHAALTAKAIAAAVSVASAQGVKIDEPKVLANQMLIRCESICDLLPLLLV